MNILAEAFGMAAWLSLTDDEREAVRADYQSAVVEDDIDYMEYRRRIGRDNLTSYARTLMVGKQNRAALKGWPIFGADWR